MKFSAVKFIGSVLMLAAFLLFSTDSMGQDRSTRVSKTDQDIPVGDFTSVTKTYEFDSGGLSIRTVSSDVDYTVYERRDSRSDWQKTDSGTAKMKDKSTVNICQINRSQVKVEVRVSCEDCAIIKRTTCN